MFEAYWRHHQLRHVFAKISQIGKKNRSAAPESSDFVDGTGDVVEMLMDGILKGEEKFRTEENPGLFRTLWKPPDVPPGTPRPSHWKNGNGYQLDDDSKSLHRKWLEMKQTSNQKLLFGVPGTSSWIFLVEKILLPRNLTWNLKMMHSKRNFLVRDFFSGSMLNFGGVQRGFLIDVFWLKGEQLCVRILIVVEGIYLGCGPLTVTVVNEGL